MISWNFYGAATFGITPIAFHNLWQQGSEVCFPRNSGKKSLSFAKVYL